MIAKKLLITYSVLAALAGAAVSGFVFRDYFATKSDVAELKSAQSDLGRRIDWVVQAVFSMHPRPEMLPPPPEPTKPQGEGQK